MKLLALASTALLAAALGCSTATSGKGGTAGASPGQSAPAAVNTVAVVSKKLRTTIMLPAQLTPYEQVDIYPKVTGFVETVTVDRGSRVRRGQVLVKLTAPELVSQRSQAEAAVRAAQSQLATAQAKLASDNGTYLHMQEAAKTPGVLAANDVLVAGQTVSADKGLVDAAEQNIAAAKDGQRSISQTESYLTITAPFEGIVTTRNLHPGALIGPASGPGGAQPILQIVDDKRLRLVVPVPEAQLGDMKLGQLVTFTVPAYPGQTFQAPIERISREVDEKSRTMPVELDVVNRAGTPDARQLYDCLMAAGTGLSNALRSYVCSDQRSAAYLRDSRAQWPGGVGHGADGTDGCRRYRSFRSFECKRSDCQDSI